MDFTLAIGLVSLGLLLGMLLFVELGRRIGARRLAQDAEGARAGVGAVEGAVFALLGLLLAFTFSGAASRFDTRRHLVVEEANAIGTAYLRLDLLPAETQPALRELFRNYVDARLEIYRKLPDIAAAKAELDRATALQGEIWSKAVSAGKGSQPATMLLLPALNQMIDITTTRTATTLMHPPPIIFAMLAILALAASMLIGYSAAGSKTRNWLHIAGFAAIMTVTVYVIAEIEFPRLGLIRVDAIDQLLVEVRKGMN